MKYCKRCDKNLPKSSFTKSVGRYDGLQVYCSECMKLYRKEHYEKNKKPYKDRAKAKTKEVRKFLKEYKSGKSCMDCGVSYNSWVLEFDHRDGEEKIKDVSQIASYGKKKLLEEIEKCDLVCANCHRERTAKRNEWV